MLHEEESYMAHSDEFRAIAERIAALSTAQIRTSEIIKNSMKDGQSGENKSRDDKKVISTTSATPNPDTDLQNST